MQGDIVDQGVELMLFGMGTVVVFLSLLILATSFMSWVLRRYFPEPEPVHSGGAPRSEVSPSAPAGQEQLVAVITAAVHRYRADKVRRKHP